MLLVVLAAGLVAGPLSLPLECYYRWIGLEKRIITTPTYSVSCFDSGESHLPVLVLVHGFMLSSGLNWCNVAQKLKGRYRLIIPDMLYANRKNVLQKGYALQNDARLLEELLEALAVDAPVIVLFSAGALLAPHLDREKTLVIVSPPPVGEGFTRDVEALFARDGKWFAESTFATAPLGFFLYAQYLFFAQAEFLPRLKDVFLEQEQYWREYVPPASVFFVVPDDDQYFPSAKNSLLHRVPAGQAFALPGAGHAATWDAADGIISIMEHFTR